MQCTVVSMVPYALREYKPQLMPGTFVIPAADEGDIQILHVDNCKYPIYLGEDRGYVQVTTLAEEVSQSIVDDFICAQLALDEDARPGMFWVEGAHSKDEILKKFPEKIAEAKRVQRNWYTRIIKLADSDFAKTKSIRAIPDVAFKAAKALRLENLPWMLIDNSQSQKFCPFCKSPVEAAAAICAKCSHIVNKPLYDALMASQEPKADEKEDE